MTYPAIDNLPPIHPGEILRDELEALGLSAANLAEHIGVPPATLIEVLKGDRGIDSALALRLGKAFGTDPRYWRNLQAIYETKVAARNSKTLLRQETITVASERANSV